MDESFRKTGLASGWLQTSIGKRKQLFSQLLKTTKVGWREILGLCSDFNKSYRRRALDTIRFMQLTIPLRASQPLLETTTAVIRVLAFQLGILLWLWPGAFGTLNGTSFCSWNINPFKYELSKWPKGKCDNSIKVPWERRVYYTTPLHTNSLRRAILQKKQSWTWPEKRSLWLISFCFGVYWYTVVQLLWTWVHWGKAPSSGATVQSSHCMMPPPPFFCQK